MDSPDIRVFCDLMALRSTKMIHFTCVPVLTSDKTDLQRTIAESQKKNSILSIFICFLGPHTKTNVIASGALSARGFQVLMQLLAL